MFSDAGTAGTSGTKSYLRTRDEKYHKMCRGDKQFRQFRQYRHPFSLAGDAMERQPWRGGRSDAVERQSEYEDSQTSTERVDAPASYNSDQAIGFRQIARTREQP